MSCTHTFQLNVSEQDQGKKPVRNDTLLFCWRARETLTVSLLVLTSPPGYEQTAAQAVEEVWALEQ